MRYIFRPNNGDMDSILRCQLCRKPFDKGRSCLPRMPLVLTPRFPESSLKRHGYYCRSRKVGSVNRPRSCITCARDKARCDNRRSECSRCKAKGIECCYPKMTSRVPVAKDHYRDESAPSEVRGKQNAEHLLPFAELLNALTHSHRFQ